ncbi:MULTISPECIES: putative quinol monooxygenase [unclassified Pseudoalteromonas]|uniref:putative quinol monooxygenase n=1 Tax=unclassified Pseudoalteromonas TaxID=194690 RepID=UPI000B3CB1A0|nr:MULTISPECIES: putative quinol monooxygenase [unclassified Pseudoalteromonas]MDN3377241.1 putative quinol monooxygenase [Pseudoalteromonas sp. APC 3893]MDN3385591.1 putative quinol monooxygenase [Pseudoalteromonas sp. APC 4017]OUS73106.1 antibiotic biosynthesis monooxygenase [Pseudoalteromonas sp. A601]
MNQLTVVANIVAHQDKTELVKNALFKLIDETRKEPGCIRYELHQDVDNSSHFIMYEQWKTTQLWSEHTQTEHIKAYSATVEGAIAHFTINKLTLIK